MLKNGQKQEILFGLFLALLPLYGHLKPIKQQLGRLWVHMGLETQEEYGI